MSSKIESDRDVYWLERPSMLIRTLFVVALLLISSCSPRTAERPNILFILSDDLGYADLGVYGGAEFSTPNIDSLAAEGMRFTQFYTNGAVCSPTRAALLTGQYPQKFGIREGIKSATTRGIPAAIETLPDTLRAAGYETFHVGKWHLGHGRSEVRPLGQGYDRFFGFLHAWFLPSTYFDPELVRDEQPAQQFSGHLEDLLTAETVGILRNRKPDDPPFFLTFWSFSPHTPYEPPPRWAGKYEDSKLGRYQALVATLDENVGLILAALDEEELADNTIVVFASDNGGVGRPYLPRDQNGPFRGVKNYFEEGGVRVPLIVRWPGRVAAGAVRDELVVTHDWPPTLAELAGAAPIADTVGRSLVPTLRGEDLPQFEGTIFWEDYQGSSYRFAVRQGRWKLLVTEGTAELYDLELDPGEADDRAANNPEVVSRLEAAYRLWRLETSRLAFEVGGANGDVIADQPMLDPGDGEFTFVTKICPQPAPEVVAAPWVIADKGEGWRLLLTAEYALRVEAGGEVLESDRPIPPGRCSQVAFTFFHMGLHRGRDTTGRLRLFLDAELVGRSNKVQPLTPSDLDVHLGRSQAGDREFPGRVQLPLLFNTALSADEIRELAVP